MGSTYVYVLEVLGLTVASKYFVLTLAFELRLTPGHLPLGGGQQSNVNLTVQLNYSKL